ncbi:MAG: MobQ family relaxase [Rhizomicrobium sp.]
MSSSSSAYHLSVKTISRASRTKRLADGTMRTRPGRTAVAAAAYRAARLLRRWLEGKIAMTHDFRAKRGVIASYILAPAGAGWALDRERLWNAAEDAETRKNSVTAREYEIAIPADLPESERFLVVRDFAQSLVDQFGVAVDLALHAPSVAGDQRNYHAHLLTTTRVVTADGLGAKTRALDARGTGPKLVEEIRARWASLCNSALERAGSATRVDHRSYVRRGITRRPMLHEGHRATALTRRLGVATRYAAHNAVIRAYNASIDAILAILRAAAAAPPAAAPVPMRLMMPGPRLTLPPTVAMEISNEQSSATLGSGPLR